MINKAKFVTSTFQSPTCQAISTVLLETVYEVTQGKRLGNIDKGKEKFGLVLYGNGAMIGLSSLVNVLVYGKSYLFVFNDVILSIHSHIISFSYFSPRNL